ncbi:MAG TPA: hypothetical protein VMT44_06150 [Methanoregula sp.]|nr:hypothetical protein [Methanoregula sp.]
MPITAEEFLKGTTGANCIASLLRENPDKAYSLHEIEEEIIGKEMNRMLHLDIFIAELILLAPLLFETGEIECRHVNRIPYFRWSG